jgi:hypothetical protein
MKTSTENFEKILKYRQKKMKELKRNVSFSEAIAMWFSEAAVKDEASEKTIVA